MKLTEGERLWVLERWKLIRESQNAADRANKVWHEINDAIKSKHHKEDQRRFAGGRPPKTDLQKAEEKKASLALRDALDTGNWHSRNAERLTHDVTLFLRLKELGIL